MSSLAMAGPQKRVARWTARFLLFVLVAGAAGTSTAFEVIRVNNDPCDSGSRNLSWPSAAAPVDVDIGSPPGFGSLAGEAYSRWNDKVQRFRFQSGYGEPCDLNDGVVTVTFGTTDCGGDPLHDVLGLTISRWRSNGELLDAQVIVNSNSVARTNEAVFLQVVMHELGHVLGLDHSDACGSSGEGTLMRSVLLLSQPRLDEPQFDDIAGANFIYAPSGGGDDTSEEVTSCAVMPPSAHHSVFPFLLIPLLFGLRRVLRRRRTGVR